MRIARGQSLALTTDDSSSEGKRKEWQKLRWFSRKRQRTDVKSFHRVYRPFIRLLSSITTRRVACSLLFFNLRPIPLWGSMVRVISRLVEGIDPRRSRRPRLWSFVVHTVNFIELLFVGILVRWKETADDSSCEGKRNEEQRYQRFSGIRQRTNIESFRRVYRPFVRPLSSNVTRRVVYCLLFFNLGWISVRDRVTVGIILRLIGEIDPRRLRGSRVWLDVVDTVNFVELLFVGIFIRWKETVDFVLWTSGQGSRMDFWLTGSRMKWLLKYLCVSGSFGSVERPLKKETLYKYTTILKLMLV